MYYFHVSHIPWYTHQLNVQCTLSLVHWIPHTCNKYIGIHFYTACHSSTLIMSLPHRHHHKYTQHTHRNPPRTPQQRRHKDPTHKDTDLCIAAVTTTHVTPVLRAFSATRAVMLELQASSCLKGRFSSSCWCEVATPLPHRYTIPSTLRHFA